MKIGIRAHDLGKQENIMQIAKLTHDFGFACVQLVLEKALLDWQNSLTKAGVIDIANTFMENKVEIALLGAYFNPIHSDKEKVDVGINKFKEYLKYANDFNCLYVGTETGSYNNDKWTYHYKNHTDEAFYEVCNIVKQLTTEAKKHEAFVAIEPAYNHVIFSPKQTKRMIDEVNSENLVIIVDLYNLLNINNHISHQEIFNECLSLFKDKIKILHLKDYIVENNELKQVSLGEGLMDYNYILKRAKTELNNIPLIFEGIQSEKIQSSLKYIKNFL